MMLFASTTLVFAGCSGDKSQATVPDNGEKVVKKSDATEEQTTQIETDGKLLNQVSYYQPKKKVEKVAPIHNQGQKIVKKIATKKKIKLEVNLQDQKYRDFVMGFATDLEGLTKAEIKIIAEYAKYVDEYENKIKNNDLKKYVSKIKSGKKLTAAELSEFKSLLPISKGTKLLIGKKKPVKNLPKIEAKPDENRNKPINEQVEPKPNENSNEGPTGSTNGNANNEEKGNDVIGDLVDTKNGSTDNTNATGGPTDGNTTGSNNGNNTTNTNGTNGDNNNTPSNNIPSGDVESEPQTLKASGSYNAKKAKEYAYKWWNKRNNKEYGYYSRVSGCEDCWYDCTNFVSQALQVGGIKEQRTGGTYWYYSNKKPSYAWGVANSFYNHFITRAKQTSSMWDLEVGDVVNVDFDHDGDIEHTAIVTKVNNAGVYVTQHTTDKKDSPLINWFTAGYDVYGWKMKTANKGR